MQRNRYSAERFGEDGATVFRHACKLGLEGIALTKVDKEFRK
jgi:ATP-dependent DNA ligase